MNEDGTPKPEAQRNFTDPDSRIMQDKQGGFSQAYNPHIAVDEASHVILAHGISNLAPDCPYFLPMLDRVTKSLGRAPETATADAGYMSRENLDGTLLRGVQPYLAVQRERRSWPPPPITEGAPPEGSSPRASSRGCASGRVRSSWSLGASSRRQASASSSSGASPTSAMSGP